MRRGELLCPPLLVGRDLSWKTGLVSGWCDQILPTQNLLIGQAQQNNPKGTEKEKNCGVAIRSGCWKGKKRGSLFVSGGINGKRNGKKRTRKSYISV